MTEWEDKLMVHNWPECGPGGITLEALYQMFRDRLMREMTEMPETIGVDGEDIT